MESITKRKPGGLKKFRLTNREECGVVVSTPEGLEYVLKVPNRAENDDDYTIYLHDVNAVKAVLSEGEEVTGFMHTHLANHKCEPSPRDLEGAALFPKMVNLIYQPSTNEFCWYTASGVIS